LLTGESSAGPLTIPEFDAALGSFACFENRPFLAVAVSGGPDSLALAILADRWARERRGEICALTVDHRLRPESGAEVQQLRSWLSARAIRHEVLVWSGEKPTTGIQKAARVARYRLLAGWCREHGCLHLLTAHHRDDQIETHLIRRRAHSGLDGLAGMSVIRELADCRIVRPLLAFSKDRLVAFLNAEGQPFVTDPSNTNPAFERSRLRHGEGIMASTTEFSGLLAEIRRLGTRRAAREHELDRALAQSLSLHPAGFAVFDPGIMLAISNELAERMLNAIVATIGGTRYPSRRERIARLRGVLDGALKRAHTLGGCRFVHWRDRVLVMRELVSAAKPARLTPGERIVWDRRFEVILPADSIGPVTIGYLGAAGLVQFNRRDARRPQGPLPRLLFPILPATWDEDGIMSVPHLGYSRDEVSALPQFLFRPVNPLTQAGFVVV
jgi:tRNA(Ile)-lysidine synthase